MKAIVQDVYGSADVLRLRDIDRDAGRYDVVIDTAGNRSLSLLRRAMTRHGRLVVVGGEHGGGRVLGGFDRQLRAPLVSMFVGQRLRGLIATEGTAELEAITRLIDSRAVTPVIDHAYPLVDAPHAIRYLTEGHAAGKPCRQGAVNGVLRRRSRSPKYPVSGTLEGTLVRSPAIATARTDPPSRSTSRPARIPRIPARQ